MGYNLKWSLGDDHFFLCYSTIRQQSTLDGTSSSMNLPNSQIKNLHIKMLRLSDS